jgi:hypothetical protein
VRTDIGKYFEGLHQRSYFIRTNLFPDLPVLRDKISLSYKSDLLVKNFEEKVMNQLVRPSNSSLIGFIEPIFEGEFVPMRDGIIASGSNVNRLILMSMHLDGGSEEPGMPLRSYFSWGYLYSEHGWAFYSPAAFAGKTEAGQQVTDLSGCVDIISLPGEASSIWFGREDLPNTLNRIVKTSW